MFFSLMFTFANLQKRYYSGVWNHSYSLQEYQSLENKIDHAIMILDLFIIETYIKSQCSITLRQKDLHKTVLIVGVKLFIYTLTFCFHKPTWKLWPAIERKCLRLYSKSLAANYSVESIDSWSNIEVSGNSCYFFTWLTFNSSWNLQSWYLLTAIAQKLLIRGWLSCNP